MFNYLNENAYGINNIKIEIKSASTTNTCRSGNFSHNRVKKLFINQL
jgi:hypothetical protein